MERRLFIAMLAAGLSVAQTQAAVDFVKDVQPILQKSCLSCHGADKHKGDLRLDSKTAAMKGGKDGVVIVPGHADKSDFYRRITLPSTDDDVMPSKGDLLTKAQQDLIKDWINAGADWPDGTIATLPAETETAAAMPYSDLTPFKPSAAETAALAKLNAGPTQVRLVAANVTWREANFHSQGTNVTDATITPLKEVASLVDLNLSTTRITDAGLQTVGGLTNLESLHLEHTKITDAGLANLKMLTHLVYLNLYGTAVTDQGIESLKSLTSLKHLYLWQTKVTADGADNLKKALPKLRISRGWENDPIAIAAKAEAEAKAKADAEAKVKADADAKAKADADAKAKADAAKEAKK